MGKYFFLLLVSILICKAAFSGEAAEIFELTVKGKIEFKFVSSAAKDNSETVKFNNETLYLDKEPVFTEKDIESLIIEKGRDSAYLGRINRLIRSMGKANNVAVGNITPATALLITFKKENKQKLKNVTEKNIGKRLACKINNEIISAPVIREAIKSGKIAFALSEDAEEKLKKQLKKEQ